MLLAGTRTKVGRDIGAMSPQMSRTWMLSSTIRADIVKAFETF